MRIIRFLEDSVEQLAAVLDDEKVYVLPDRDFMAFVHRARKENKTPSELISAIVSSTQPRPHTIEQLDLIIPIDAPEVWAAGVTYERSKEARNYEATGGKPDATTCYDKVYDAVRPEIFIKSTSARTVGPGAPVYLRSDSKWQVPEPELGLVLDREGTILGYTIGNDMSCRDIEGENPLYLPQAKIWRNSCSIGPSIRLAETVTDPYQLQINCRIFRDDAKLVEETTSTRQLKRRFDELIHFLKLDNVLFEGTILLTGTCIVPPNHFTLVHGDRIEIDITGIGTLVNFAQEAHR